FSWQGCLLTYSRHLEALAIMSAVFADAFYFPARLNPEDESQERGSIQRTGQEPGPPARNAQNSARSRSISAASTAPPSLAVKIPRQMPSSRRAQWRRAFS